MKNYLKENHFTKYEKDHTYNVIYKDKNGEQKEKQYTPDKDTSIAGIIEGFKTKNDDFFKLIEITSNKEDTQNYAELPSNAKFDIDELLKSGIDENQLKEDNIEYTFNAIKEEYPELKDSLDDVKSYIQTKADDLYSNNDLQESNKKSKFDKLSDKISKEDNISSEEADAIAASIGRKKYGKQKFQKMAMAGKKTEDVTDDNKLINISDLKEIAEKTLPLKDIDTHESDLYIRKTPESEKLINKLKNKNSGLLSTFKDNVSGDIWYDIPFGNLQNSIKNESQQNEILNTEGKDGFIDRISEYDSDVIADAILHYAQMGDINTETLTNILNMCRESNGESVLTEKNKPTGIFNKKDAKSFLGDINREIGLDFIKSLDNNIDVELPTKGTLYNNDSAIQYEFNVINSKGADLVSIGEQIANKMKDYFGESGKILDVKCIPSHKPNNKQVLTLSIIGPDIVKVQESLLKEEENPDKVEQDVKNAVEELPEDSSDIGADVISGNIDVLIADETAAIDGYNSFLTQLKSSMIPAIYDIIEKEIKEIIKDEEDHIDKLTAIKEGLSSIVD